MDAIQAFTQNDRHFQESMTMMKSVKSSRSVVQAILYLNLYWRFYYNIVYLCKMTGVL